jgi:hypothetical protein
MIREGAEMGIVWGLVIMVLSLPCWGGQVLSWLQPTTAVRLSLMEAEVTVEPAYFADIRGEALWDSLTLWTLPTAGALLVIDSSAWPYFGLVGGAIYSYFAGRGIFTRREMRHRGFRVGEEQNVKIGFLFLAIWGLLGVATILTAGLELTR